MIAGVEIVRALRKVTAGNAEAPRQADAVMTVTVVFGGPVGGRG